MIDRLHGRGFPMESQAIAAELMCDLRLGRG